MEGENMKSRMQYDIYDKENDLDIEIVMNSLGKSFFDELLSGVWKNLEGKEVDFRYAYLFQRPILNCDEFDVWGVYWKKVLCEELDSIYFQHLLETNQILEKYPILTFDDKGIIREVMTGIGIPKLGVYSIPGFFHQNIFARIGMSIYPMENTNFFVFNQKKEATYKEVIDYFKAFKEKENYLSLLNTLLVISKSYQYESHLELLGGNLFLPEQLKSFYENLDQENLKQQLVRRLKK